MNVIQTNTTNYLVPSSGNTHGVNFNGVYTATPYQIDWRQFSVDNFPFSPQGVFIDNSRGTASLVINFQPLNFNVVCPAGIVGQFQFPAVDQQTCSITGNGQAVVTFVDFPVLPNSGITQIGNTVNVNITGPNPLPVSLPAGAQSVQGPTLSNASSAAYEASHIIKAATGKLFILSVYSSKAATQWIQLHDAAALPADGAVPVLTLSIATVADLMLDWSIFGRNFANGIVVCNSTTGPTKTIGAADCFFDAQFI